MASSSRAPDISERVVLDLSGRASAYYDPNTYKYDVAIGTLPFIYAITDNTPYRRQTAEFRTQRFDNSRDPGEQSLSGSGYWIRSQSSFHLGAGAEFQEPIVGTPEEIRFRYLDSTGIDIWTPGKFSLLRSTTLQEGSASRAGVFSTTIAGVDYLIKVTGASTETIRVLRIRISDGAETTIINNSQITEEILYGAMGGNDLMLVTPTKVWRYSFDDAVPALHQDYAINTANAASANIGYVKQRFILAYSDVNKSTFVYELPINTGSTINLSTLTAVNGSTTLPRGFSFTAVTESSGAIYVGGYSGDQGLAFKITVDTSGVLSTMVTVLILPRGEILTALYGYLGTFVMVGTSQGVRVAISDDNANLSYGPLIFETTSPVYAFTARNEYVWAGVAGEIGGYSGLIRFNLGSPLSTGGYAYAKDIYAVETTGAVWSVATLPDGRKAFTVADSGLWIEDEEDLVESGQITTGIIRFDTFENKAWKRIRLRFDGALGGAVDMFRTVDGVNSIIQTVQEGTTQQFDYDLAVAFSDVSAEAQFTFRLNRSIEDTTVGAVLLGYSVKALPTPTRARVLQIPIFCFDKETDRNRQIIGFEGYALARVQALEQLEAQGESLIIQDFTAGGEPTEAVVEQVTFTRTSPPNAGFSGYGGIIQVIARTVV
jgi:hypothetical protein